MKQSNTQHQTGYILAKSLQSYEVKRAYEMCVRDIKSNTSSGWRNTHTYWRQAHRYTHIKYEAHKDVTQSLHSTNIYDAIVKFQKGTHPSSRTVCGYIYQTLRCEICYKYVVLTSEHLYG